MEEASTGATTSSPRSRSRSSSSGSTAAGSSASSGSAAAAASAAGRGCLCLGFAGEHCEPQCGGQARCAEKNSRKGDFLMYVTFAILGAVVLSSGVALLCCAIAGVWPSSAAGDDEPPGHAELGSSGSAPFSAGSVFALPGITVTRSSRPLPGLQTGAEDAEALVEAPGGRGGAASGGSPRIVFGFTVQNLNLSRLVGTSNALAIFNATVMQAVAAEAGPGFPVDAVHLAFLPAYSVVRCELRPPGQVDPYEARSRLFRHGERLRALLEFNLQALAVLGAHDGFASSEIGVGNLTQPTLLGAPSTTSAEPLLPPVTVTSATDSTPQETTSSRRQCEAVGRPCLLDVQCCSARCTPIHFCGHAVKPLSW